MKTIAKKAMCDDEDFEVLSQFSWQLDVDGHVVTYVQGHKIYMHDIVMSRKLASLN